MISTFMELVKEILSANIFANIGFGLYIIAFLRAEISRLRDDDDIMNMSHYMVMATSCLVMEAGFNLSNTSEMNLYLHFRRVVFYILGIIFVLFEVLIRARDIRRRRKAFEKKRKNDCGERNN